MTEIEAASLVGFLAFLLQLGLIFIGMTDQIRLLRKKQAADQISIIKQLIILASCGLWFAYGLMIYDWFIWGPQLFAVAFTSVIIGQCLWYRRRTHLTEPAPS